MVEEGQSIQPNYYLPIIPLTLVNGAEGIGTGWSTMIPQYNPRDVVRNIKGLMQGHAPKPMEPWYKGYTGDIVPVDATHSRYTVTGKYSVLGDDELEITELPIGKWTRDYKNFLEELAQKDEIDDIREYHEENRVHFVLQVPKLTAIERAPGGIEKKFKLQTSLACSNMVLFDEEGRLQRFEGAKDIMMHFYDLRAVLYEKRKEYMLAKLKKEYEMLRNKSRFIKAIIEEEVIIKRKKKVEIAKDLKRQNYATMSDLNQIQQDEKKATVVEEEKDGDGEEEKNE